MKYLLTVIILILSSTVYASAAGQSSVNTSNTQSSNSLNKGGTMNGVNSNPGSTNNQGSLNTQNNMNSNIDASSATTNSNVNINSGTTATDSNLTTNVQEKMRNSMGGTSGTNIHVETRNGTVYLTGSARTKADADRATQAATSVTGVNNVDNKITIEDLNDRERD